MGRREGGGYDIHQVKNIWQRVKNRKFWLVCRNRTDLNCCQWLLDSILFPFLSRMFFRFPRTHFKNNSWVNVNILVQSLLLNWSLQCFNQVPPPWHPIATMHQKSRTSIRITIFAPVVWHNFYETWYTNCFEGKTVFTSNICQLLITFGAF